MTLSPLQRRPKSSRKKKSVTWNDRQLAVTRLLNEASALIDIFNEVSVMLGPEMSLNQVPSDESVLIPESKLDPILTESCNDLEKALTNYRPRNYLSSAQILTAPK